MAYNEEDFLQLSGLQHFKFCRRQWAIIHIEKEWAENYFTTDGIIMHKNAHDKGMKESRGDLIITRGMDIFSNTLGISGECDVVEFHKSDYGIALFRYDGLWSPYPVEYKRGAPNARSANNLQLCAQAMCLEEMLCCTIDEGAIYYREIRRREKVKFSSEIRQEVKDCLAEMHLLYRRGYTPKVKTSKSCNACSLKEICLPKLMTKRSAEEYLLKSMKEIL